MAVILATPANLGRVIPPSPEYPQGAVQDDSTGLTGDGTPYEAQQLNSVQAFYQALMQEAEIVPNGVVDTVLDSQYFDSLKHVTRVGRKNLIINPWFTVNSYGSLRVGGGAVNVRSDAYDVDRWVAQEAGNSFSVAASLISAVVGGHARNALRCRVSNGNVSGIFGATQRCITEDLPPITMITVSCWVRSNGPAHLVQANVGGTSGDAPDTHTGGGGWERLTWTLDTAGTSGTAHSVNFGVQWRGTTGRPLVLNDYIEMTGMQVEQGTLATAVEYRRRAEEEWLCRIYYRRWTGTSSDGELGMPAYASGGDHVSISMMLDPPMRTVPDLSSVYLAFIALGSTYTVFSSLLTSGAGGAHRIRCVVGDQALAATKVGRLAFRSTLGYLELDAEL